MQDLTRSNYYCFIIFLNGWPRVKLIFSLLRLKIFIQQMTALYLLLFKFFTIICKRFLCFQTQDMCKSTHLKCLWFSWKTIDNFYQTQSKLPKSDSLRINITLVVWRFPTLCNTFKVNFSEALKNHAPSIRIFVTLYVPPTLILL